jgi:hypothetical protein
VTRRIWSLALDFGSPSYFMPAKVHRCHIRGTSFPHVLSRSLAAASNLKLKERADLLRNIWALPSNLRTHFHVYEHLLYTRRVLGGRGPRQRIICPCKPTRRGTANVVWLRILKDSREVREADKPGMVAGFNWHLAIGTWHLRLLSSEIVGDTT